MAYIRMEWTINVGLTFIRNYSLIMNGCPAYYVLRTCDICRCGPVWCHITTFCGPVWCHITTFCGPVWCHITAICGLVWCHITAFARGDCKSTKNLCTFEAPSKIINGYSWLQVTGAVSWGNLHCTRKMAHNLYEIIDFYANILWNSYIH
jgi:hypothetical protein